MKRWIKYPAPGQFRGEGAWVKLEEIQVTNCTHDEYWEWLVSTDYLPTKEQDEKPQD